MNDIQMKQLEQTLTSMEVAEMVGKTHANLLKDIRAIL
jgi:phage regulator Rha-like protein